LESTLFTTKVRSSLDRPGITSARNVTFISGRAQMRTSRDLLIAFDLLKIPISGIDLDLFLMLDLSLSWVNLLLDLFIAQFTRGRGGWLPDASENRLFNFTAALLGHSEHYNKG
jgi:hypothetical protein